jgi:hypothetical protein
VTIQNHQDIATGFDGTPWDQGYQAWGNPPWGQATDRYHSAPNSVKCTPSNEGPFSSDLISTQGASSITVSFWYYEIGTTATSQFRFRYTTSSSTTYPSESNWITVANLGNNNGQWLQVTYNIPVPSSGVIRIQFNSQNLPSGAAIWVDDLVITVQN